MQEQILEALRHVIDPDLGRDIVSLGFVKDLVVSNGEVSFSIELTTPACPVKDLMKSQAYKHVMAVPGVKKADIRMTAKVRPSPSDRKQELIPGVRNVIPVASGKGGVGKSTVSANIAISLARMGARVGLLDADVYGPSIPALLDASPGPQPEPHVFTPPVAHGVKVVSMGFFLPPGDAVIWRGPMLHKAVEQFLGQVAWGELDYLIVDLPPGTGDIQLSLCQMIPLTGAAVVSTPQDVALQVAEKAIIMFHKLNIPILGLVENMSGFVCSQCGHHEDVFGAGGARQYALRKGLPFLGEIPLATEIRATSDAGTPIVAARPDSPAALAFSRIAQNLAAQVSIRNSPDGKEGPPTPQEIRQPSRQTISIRWSDGRETTLDARPLRLECPCAECVDESTGRKLLDPSSVPPDVWPTSINPVGRYGMSFAWSDGHSSGIYTHERLRQLGAQAGS
jgi:ATP-binding protein involved in chromosome partitioning